jgi:hypothetical protein
MHVTPTTMSSAGPVLDQVAPLYEMSLPVPVAATQKEELVHETARGSPSAGIFLGVPHDEPSQMTASWVLSRNMQKDELGHETTEVPEVPWGSESMINGADQVVPFQRATASMELVATQKVADAHPTETAGPVIGSTVSGADQPGGSEVVRGVV